MEYPIAELTVERLNRLRSGPGVAFSVGASALVSEAKVYSVGFLYRLSMVVLTASVTCQNSREWEVPGGTPRVSGSSQPPLTLDVLAL